MTCPRSCSFELLKLGFEPSSVSISETCPVNHDPSSSTVQPSVSALWCSV